MSYFCQSSEIYTRIRSGGTVVRAAPKTGVAQNGKLRSLGKPYSTNSPNVNPTWSEGGFQRPPLLGPGKKEPTPGRVNNRAVPQIKRTCTPRTTLLNSHTYLASKQTHSIIIENAADQKNPALQHPLEANFHYTGRGVLQKERK